MEKQAPGNSDESKLRSLAPALFSVSALYSKLSGLTFVTLNVRKTLRSLSCRYWNLSYHLHDYSSPLYVLVVRYLHWTSNVCVWFCFWLLSVKINNETSKFTSFSRKNQTDNKIHISSSILEQINTCNYWMPALMESMNF